MVNNFCLYIHKNKLNGEIFYVGIGNDKRPYTKKGRSDYWYKYINKYGYFVEVLEENLTWDEACEKEMSLIKQIGRVKDGTGPLINLTEGGEGFKSEHSEESKKIIGEKSIGRIPWNKGLTKDTNEKIKTISQKNIGRIPWNKGCKNCQEYGLSRNIKISQKVKGFKHKKEAIDKIRQSSLNRKHTEESKNKISEHFKKPVKQVLDGNVIKIWDSIKEAQEQLGLHNISDVCLGRRKKCGGFFWEFVNKINT